MKSPVTLLDVARAANVSKSTAANVFNRPDRVRPGLRARVEQAARDLDYAGPDPRGRALSLGKANAIGVVPPADAGFSWIYTDPFMQQFLTGVSEVCEEHRASLLLIAARDPSGGSGIGEALVDGLILGTVAQADLVESRLRGRVPIVVLDAEGTPDINSISFDEAAGVRAMIRHLLDLGHRRFAFGSTIRAAGVGPILHRPGDGSPPLSYAYDQEWQTYRAAEAALAEAGLSIAQMPLIEACDSADERLRGDFASILFDAAPDATAAVSFTGALTPGLLAGALRRGLDVPSRMSIAGFTDRDIATATTPTLTAIVQPISATERGRIAARMLFDDGPPQHLLLPTELIVGGSTGPAPK